MGQGLGFFLEILLIEQLGVAGVLGGGGSFGPLAAQADKERFVGSFGFRVPSFELLVVGLRWPFSGRLNGGGRGVAFQMIGGRRFALACAALRVPPDTGVFRANFFAGVIFLILLVNLFGRVRFSRLIRAWFAAASLRLPVCGFRLGKFRVLSFELRD